MPRFRSLGAGDIKEKTGPRDLVTVADIEAEQALSPRLAALLPGSVVVGEESYHADPTIIARISGDNPVWIIDPIDGTLSFAHGNEHFGTIVALTYKGQTVGGWIHLPALGETMSVERGGGAWFRGKRLETLPSAPLEEMRGLTWSALKKRLKDLPPGAVRAKIISDSYPACFHYVQLLNNLVLGGKEEPQAHYLVLLEKSKPWDDAAGLLAYTEAGGKAANWAGKPYSPAMLNEGVIAAPDDDSLVAIKLHFDELRSRYT